MALQFVGQTSGSGTGASYTVSLNGTLTNGIASSPSVNDIVIVISAFGNTAASAPAVSGNVNGAYIGLHTALHVNDTWDTEFRAFYEVQASVDTTLTVTRVNNAAYGGATVVQVWRGVDTSNPIDVTTVTSTITNASRVGFAAITPVTAGAVIIAGAAGTQGTTGSAFTGSANMTTANSIFSNGTTSDIGVLSSYYTAWTSGAFTPNTITGGATSTSSSGASATIALRPFVAVTHATTGTLTGQIGSVSGTAVHFTVHDTTGTLSGQDSSIVGSATNFTVRTSSGVLTGQGSTIVGNADHEPMALPHTTEGTLVGQGSAVTGSSARFRAHPTSGTLTGQGSVVTGNADHEPMALPHLTDGTLIGQGSVVVGSATRYRQFSTSGQLVGQQSLVVGSAKRYLPHDTSGTLIGQGSLIVGDADHESSFHDATGNLVGLGSVIVGKAKNETGSIEITGGSRRVRQQTPLIIVEVNGIEYRVLQSQLNAFLQSIKVEAKAEAQKPLKKAKKKRKANVVEQVVTEPQIIVKSIPVNIIPEVSAKIAQTNQAITKYFSSAMDKYVQELDDEEVILMLI